MFNIRLANESDIKKVFELSNDDLVRANSINRNKILWEDHVKWFKNRIKNIDEPFYIVEDENENFISQVRFNKEDEELIISVSINKNFRGHGLGWQIISEVSQKNGNYPIVAYIKVDNIPSKKSFLKAGYIFKEKKIINGEYYEKYILL